MPYFGKLYVYDESIIKYFHSNPSRSKALFDFEKLAQEIIDKKHRHYNDQSSAIIVFAGSKTPGINEYPFHLDLHGFRRDEAKVVIEKFLSLIEKHRIQRCSIIHGKSGDTMFNVTIECLRKRSHLLEDFDYIEASKNRRVHSKYGETYVGYKVGDRQTWVNYERYDYDEEYRKTVDKYRERAERVQLTDNNKSAPVNNDCFIATAVYGSNYASEVVTLRYFRDKVLQTTKLGRLFCNIYYKYGKFLASIIVKIPILKFIVKSLIDLIVTFIYKKL